MVLLWTMSGGRTSACPELLSSPWAKNFSCILKGKQRTWGHRLHHNDLLFSIGYETLLTHLACRDRLCPLLLGRHAKPSPSTWVQITLSCHLQSPKRERGGGHFSSLFPVLFVYKVVSSSALIKLANFNVWTVPLLFVSVYSLIFNIFWIWPCHKRIVNSEQSISLLRTCFHFKFFLFCFVFHFCLMVFS